LDDVTPLRQLTPAIAAEPAHLFEPATAIRVRRNENRDTPLPPETPMGRNPPAGAVIDYTLARDLPGLVAIEIVDARGQLVRRYSSADEPEKLPATRYFADVWLKPPPPLPTTAGHHRVGWDLRGPRPKTERYNYSIAAIYGEDTPAEPEGALAMPGRYRVRLTAGGKTYAQPLALEPDPRVRTPASELARQFELATAAAAQMNRAAETLAQLRALRKEVETAKKRAAGNAAAAQAIESFDQHAAALEGRVPPRRGAAAADDSLVRLSARLSSLFSAVESGDAAPTAQAVAESEELKKLVDRRIADWNAIRTVELSALNEQLRATGLPPLGLTPRTGSGSH
jgi:hypothetical protein